MQDLSTLPISLLSLPDGQIKIIYLSWSPAAYKRRIQESKQSARASSQQGAVEQESHPILVRHHEVVLQGQWGMYLGMGAGVIDMKIPVAASVIDAAARNQGNGTLDRREA